MSNPKFTARRLDTMEFRPNADAIRIGRTQPYHLTYARAHRGNDILNPRLPGERPAASQEGEKREQH